MRARSLRSWVIPFALAATVFLPNQAVADPTAQERALAEALFREAKALLDGEKFGEACPKLEESHRLDPKAGTILNLAVCHEKQGKTATAWSDYLEAATFAARAGRKDREDFARERAAALEKEMPRLAVRVEVKVEGIEVKVDGTILKEAAWGTAAPIDPGEHTVAAVAEGYLAFSSKVMIQAGAKTTDVLVPKLSPEAAEKPVPPSLKKAGSAPLVPVPSPAPKEPDRPSFETNSAPFWLGIGASGLGLAGLIVGSVFGLRTFSQRDAGNAECLAPDFKYCSAKGLELHASAESSALISSVAFGLGLGSAAAGVLLIVSSRGPSSKPAKPSSACIAPILGPGNAGAQATFSF